MRMKYFILLFLTLCLTYLSAETPENLHATAISDDGFTLRWNAVDGIDDYQVEVWEVEEESFFSDFEEYYSTNGLYIPDGWEVGGRTTGLLVITPANVNAYSGNSCLRMYYPAYGGEYTDFHITMPIPLMNEATNKLLTEFSFYVKCDGDNPRMNLRVSALGYDGEELDATIYSGDSGSSDDFYTTYKQLSASYYLLEAEKIRFSYSYWHSGRVLIDDISIKAVDLDNVSNCPVDDSTSYNAYRVDGLESERSYIFRVKAENGDFSSWQTVTTLPDDPAYGAGTAFAGSLAQIELAAADIPQTIIISPSEVTDADYSVSLSGEGSRFTCNVSTDEAGALPGSYTIHHPGHRASNVDVSGSVSFNLQNGLESTTITIPAVARNQEIQISYELDADTLPVSLSYFDIQGLTANSCKLQWRAESESNLLGYHVYRSDTDAFADAVRLSDLIPAGNSSSAQQYSYIDRSPRYPARYFLSALSYDGSEQISGPIYADYQVQEQQAAEIQIEDFYIFPNPFNQKATLYLSLASEQELDLKIYDARGRLVRSEDLGSLSEGEHQIPFSAVDNRDKALSSGAYMLVLRYRDTRLKGKFMISK